MKNRVPFKPANTIWKAPAGANHNLVIRFSDDDTDSDSGSSSREKASKVKRASVGTDVTRRFPAAPSAVKLSNLPHSGKNINKLVPKNRSMRRTFISSTSSISAAADSRVPGPSPVEQGPQAGKFTLVRKSVGVEEQDFDPGLVLKSNTLQDLRQQIALREKELKLKASQQSRESVLVSAKGDNEMSLPSDEARNINAPSTHVGQREPKEPDRKRLKVGGSYTARTSSEGRQEILGSKSLPVSDMQVSKSSYLEDWNVVNPSHRESPARRPEMSLVLWQEQDDNQADAYLEKLSGDNMNCNGNQSAQSGTIPQDAPNHQNCLNDANVQVHGRIDFKSLIDMEELLDKGLEDALEYRRRCEIEERDALKAYRKAQRALVEANARCTELYRKRELYSTRLQTFIIEDSSLLCSSRQHEHEGPQMNLPNKKPRRVDPIATSCHQGLSEFDCLTGTGYALNEENENPSGASPSAADQNMNRKILGPELYSDPDASTSAHEAANILSPPANDPSIPADEDEETFLADNEISCLKLKDREESLTRPEDRNYSSTRNLSADASQDSLILEAALRSELFARLGLRTGSNSHRPPSMECEDESGTDADRETNNGSPMPCVDEKLQEYDIAGNGETEKSTSEASAQVQNHESSSLNVHSAADSGDDTYPTGGHQLPSFNVHVPPFGLRSTFDHIPSCPVTLLEMPAGKEEQNDNSDHHNKEAGGVDLEEIQRGEELLNSLSKSTRDIPGNQPGIFNSSVAVNPFWPLCMYELRGKCNNDECPWQHVKDLPSETLKSSQENSDTAGCEVEQAFGWRNCFGATKLSNCLTVLPSPTDLVGLDIWKVNSAFYGSMTAQTNWRCWLKHFSICLVLSGLLQEDMSPTDDEQSMHLQRRSSIVNHLNQAVANDYMQSLETALLFLSQEFNKAEGVKESLSILSRAIEADPLPEILWIIYLVIFYSNSSGGTHDMVSYAVKHNNGSYGLWLMYINSRSHLDDRLLAYETAIRALFQASTSNRDEIYASACILDLFLQMIECLCMSGNIEKAVEMIHKSFLVKNYSDEPHSLLPSDVLVYLTISDKYVFWVCCIYLVIYRKLPNAVVQRIECEKEVLAIHWDSVCLLDEERNKAIKLLEMAVNSFKLHIHGHGESCESEAELCFAQQFAVSHIRCMAALNDMDCCQNLLEKYQKMYPYCLELMLLSIGVHTNISEPDFTRFKEILSKWGNETPGIQCVWNQYVGCALEKGGLHSAKEVIIGWWCNTFLKATFSRNENDSHSLLDLTSALDEDIFIKNSNPIDTMFGYLNLSVARLLQNDHGGARSAVDKAFQGAPFYYFPHCLREHANFLLVHESKLKEEATMGEHLKILRSYVDRACSFPVSEPLSRKFINNVEKQRVQQLINNMFSPVSSDFSTVNLALGVWYGPSLLPQNVSNVKELVDFVEAVLELGPSNYPLVISACKFLRKGGCSRNTQSSSILYWGSSNLVNTILHAVPIPPEYIWVEAAGILQDIDVIKSVSDMFYLRALSVYPFSRKLWSCYYELSKTRGDMDDVVKAAREKGIELI